MANAILSTAPRPNKALSVREYAMFHRLIEITDAEAQRSYA